MTILNKYTNLILTLMLAALLSACLPAVVGGAAVGGSVAVDRRTAGIYVEDENIEIKAGRQMSNSLSAAAHINITSYNRNVLLTGEAPNAEVKIEAGNLIKEIANVRNITNEIAVAPISTLGSRTNDTYLTSKVKTKLLADSNVSANNIKVVTENSAVYLMGLVTREEADVAVEIARSTQGVTKVVKVFEYTN